MSELFENLSSVARAHTIVLSVGDLHWLIREKKNENYDLTLSRTREREKILAEVGIKFFFLILCI